jgi:hypothetical protein
VTCKPQGEPVKGFKGVDIPLLPKEWLGLEKGKLYTFACYSAQSSLVEIYHPNLKKDVDKRK